MLDLFKKKINRKITKPVYYLYTRTLTNDYEFKNEFVDDLEISRNLRNCAYKAAIDLHEKNVAGDFLQRDSDKNLTLCWQILDGRKDFVGRRIFSYFGVVIDINDNDFDIDDFKKQVERQIRLMKNSSTNSFVLAQKFPIIWNDSKDKEFPKKR